jgi:hypothetical protein
MHPELLLPIAQDRHHDDLAKARQARRRSLSHPSMASAGLGRPAVPSPSLRLVPPLRRIGGSRPVPRPSSDPRTPAA